jgi:hypothetical protein
MAKYFVAKVKEKKMKKRKSIFVLALTAFVVVGVFAQEEASEASESPPIVHKHQPFDMLLGINLGFGLTPNMITDLSDAANNGRIPKGNYAITFDFGLTYDFYLYNWLSFNTGLLLHPDLYIILDQNIEKTSDFTDIASASLCLTIPLAAHVNIPKVEWLYAGIGLNLNIPLSGMLDGAVSVEYEGVDEDENGAPPTKLDTKGGLFCRFADRYWF